jgi:hypothetical protein
VIVGEIDRIRRAGDHDGEEDKREQPQVRDDRRLEERQIEGAGLHFEQRTHQENSRHHRGDQKLDEKFQSPADAIGFLLGDLQVIVHKTERAEHGHGEKSEPDKAIIRTRPKHGGKHDRADDQDPTHGGDARLGAVQFRQSMDFMGRANRLADLERDQFADDEISAEERERERRDRGRDAPEGDVGENVQRSEFVAPEMQIKHHGELLTAAC